MFRITLGMCVKNAEGTIRAALNSILRQDFILEEIEFIFVEGNSRDKTLDIINNVISRRKLNTRIFHDKGEGLGAARQIVVDNTHSEYILWVDSDVMLSKDFIGKQLKFMEKNPNVVMAKGKSQYIYSEKNLLGNIHNLFFNIARTSAVHMAATICRTKALREVMRAR